MVRVAALFSVSSMLTINTDLTSFKKFLPNVIVAYNIYLYSQNGVVNIQNSRGGNKVFYTTSVFFKIFLVQ